MEEKGSIPSEKKTSTTVDKQTPIHIWLGGQKKTPRLTKYQKAKIRKFCFQRDKKRCPICKKQEPEEPEERSIALTIDHIDGDITNHYSDNLRLVHHGCNTTEYHRIQKVRQKGNLHDSERKNMRQLPTSTSLEIREPISKEIVLNEQNERFFRRQCFMLVLQRRSEGKDITKRDMRKIARTETGCSMQSSYSYMEPLFAPNGPMEELEDIGTGTLYVLFRDRKDFTLTLDQLEMKYPKEGKRFSNTKESIEDVGK